MTLGTLMLGIAITALVLTGLMYFITDRIKNILLSYLQNFVGALFIFSGWVKAIDPLGTAYKMEQYFGEFESTFSHTWFSFLAPLFPWLSNYVTAFSVIMIVFEITLGVMLIIGALRKLTSWAFLILVLFFTFLTSFTFLTGYVPEGVNFFQFGSWGPYVETNMKVTDCGCFGDFLKLEPKVSFLKDVFLLIPGILFVIAWKHEHQLFKANARNIITLLTIAATTVYCFSNFSWDLPHTDFRPFREGVNIGEQKILEEEAAGNVKIEAYEMTNKQSGQVVRLPFDQYMKEFKKYPKEEWDLEQIKSEPEVAHTKISEFDVSDVEGNEVTEEILTQEGYSFMVIAYRLYGTEGKTTQVVSDSIFVNDSIPSADTMIVLKRFDRVDTRQETIASYSWDPAYVEKWRDIINPIMNAGAEKGVKTYAITAYSDPARILDFQKAIGAEFPIYLADDILLKTIIRSNPGLVLMKDGTIIKKWHYKKLPDFATIQEEYLQ